MVPPTHQGRVDHGDDQSSVCPMPTRSSAAALRGRRRFSCVERTDTNAFAHVLLPAAAWGEKDGTVTNSDRRISRQRAFLPLPGEAKPDWWIISQVAHRMGFAEAFGYANAHEIFLEHARLSSARNDGSRAFDIGG
jgi:NADH dehydrogenase/NADH:ubiquinone oxidoreductase subunit G